MLNKIHLSLIYFKPNIIQIINSNYLDYNLRKITTEITKKIIDKNVITKKYLSKYINISSYISYSLINNIFLHYYSSSITDCLFNFINISSYNNNLPISSIESTCISKSLFLINKFIEPIIIEKIRKKYIGVLIIKGVKISNIIMKLLYMIKDDFMHTNIFNYFFGIMTVNKGKSDEKIDTYLFLIYIFINISYKCYNKIKEKEEKKEKERKKLIKIINEKRKNIVIPPPSNEYYLIRNKNFFNIIKNKKGFCLICNKKFIIPTAIKCCGGVFCYKCINNYLLLNHKCFLCLQFFNYNKDDLNKLLIKLYS